MGFQDCCIAKLPVKSYNKLLLLQLLQQQQQPLLTGKASSHSFLMEKIKVRAHWGRLSCYCKTCLGAHNTYVATESQNLAIIRVMSTLHHYQSMRLTSLIISIYGATGLLGIRVGSLRWFVYNCTETVERATIHQISVMAVSNSPLMELQYHPMFPYPD